MWLTVGVRIHMIRRLNKTKRVVWLSVGVRIHV